MKMMCEVCTREYDRGTEQACCIQVHGDCLLCRAAEQKYVDQLAVAQLQTTHMLTIASARSMRANNVATQKHMVRTFTVSVACSKEKLELTDLIAGRIYSMDGVEDVTVTEHNLKELK